MVLAKLFRPWRDSVPTAVELRSADFSPPPAGTFKSAGSGMNSALQVRRNWLNSTASLVEDEQLVIFGQLAVEFAVGEAEIFVIEFVAVGDDVLFGRNGHERFPAIGQHWRALHGVLVEADDDVRFYGILDQALLAAVPLDGERILPVVFARQAARSQVGDGGGAATDQHPGEQK